MQRGERDFSMDLKATTIKRFINKELAIIGNIIGENLKFEPRKEWKYRWE